MLYCSAKKIYTHAEVISADKKITQRVSRNQLELALKLLNCDFKLSVSHENRVFKRFLKNLELTNCLSFERKRLHLKVYFDPHGIHVKPLPEC